ncbi:MAG TPA: mannose-1-phosphate guanylyltransferase [Bacteroidales bacterium]|jgi:mannose-1-phosphate guanylyltransferase|nr:mannose-1-phosphate guanylyltransferase [Bacteroidales bacterium]MDI9533049.1 mannose-1-phosphate guanylyltransferase [Bacteroidota bacterium]HMT67621.1 mannose-1-phosphate guanylyltransferase [Bacteroidales bacterium]HNY58278.1 mannose-1-phosphate guanylyltransferase [Bacteroidales bacterium]HOC04641.1 mannose-1-phosphate guanylyltransferase [Bacteroidales bacterium]
MKNRYVLIMAGGVGSRFWPLSRREKSKQFLDILGIGETLIQMTYRRFTDICPPENIYVVTNEDSSDTVVSQLGIDPDHVLAEPLRRNTAPCIAYGVFRIMAENPDAVIAVAPSDHLIRKQDKFRMVMDEAFRFASGNDVLLTLGIKPDRPETGYGYIQANTMQPVAGYEGLHKVKAFTEKPELAMAKLFLESGDFYWNSGIFIWKASTILESYSRYLPDTFHTFNEGKELFGTAGEKEFITQAYSQCSSISVDYGIMEKADNVYVICTDLGWSDLGTWSSLYLQSEHDRNDNAVLNSKALTYNSEGNIISLPQGKIAVIQGLDDYIIIDSGDVLLIVSRDQEQNIKTYLNDVGREAGENYL